METYISFSCDYLTPLKRIVKDVEVWKSFRRCNPMSESRPENVVYIGVKPVMNYVVACMTLFNAGMTEVTVKARGMAIPRAVDTVEVVRRSFIKDLEVRGINIGTEQLTSQDGRMSNVSTMEIIIGKSSAVKSG